jgi:hypothetical protein
VEVSEPVLAREPGSGKMVEYFTQDFYPVVDAVFSDGFMGGNPIADDVEVTAAFGLESEDGVRNLLVMEPLVQGDRAFIAL